MTSTTFAVLVALALTLFFGLAAITNELRRIAAALEWLVNPLNDRTGVAVLRDKLDSVAAQIRKRPAPIDATPEET
jgi:hypothetical protein